jgi:hypothetical protein
VGDVANTKFPVPVWLLVVRAVPPPIATDVGVMAPRVKVIAGVVVGVATVPETPFAVVTDTLSTVPVLVPQVGQAMTPAELMVIGEVPLNPALPTALMGSWPVTPVESGNPVAFVSTSADGVPKAGVTRVGEVPKTAKPVPVLVVRAESKLAEDGVARNVATPVPKPETPVEIGSPVRFVATPLEGVPSAGVTNVGLVARANTVPVPVVV